MITTFLLLGLSLYVLLSSFHEVSCQDDGSGLSHLDLMERDYQDHLQGKNDEDQSAKIQNENQKNNTVTDKNTISLSISDDSTQVGSVREESFKSSSLIDQIELEFEAHLNSLNQVGSNGVKADSKYDEEYKVADSTGSKDDDEQSAKRLSMLEEIEREFEAATKSLEQLEVRDSIGDNIEQEEAAKRQSMLDEIQREFQDSLKKILSEESKIEETDTKSMSASLIQLFESHRKEKETPFGSHRVLTSRESSSVTSETVETLRAKLKELRGLTARELVTHKDFDKILITAASFEELSSAPISYIARLDKYRNVIKEGLEASERVHTAQVRATMLKETAVEKQAALDSHFASAKTLAQEGDALYVRILAVEKQLAKLEAEKESFGRKFEETTKELSHLLVDASEAYEEYHGAVRKANEEKAAEEFAKEATESAEIIWVKFLSSL